MDFGDTTRMATVFLLASCATWTLGCGTIKTRTATDQLLVSDAVDNSIAQIDFTQLSGRRVYLDTQFLKPVRTVGFVNTEYIISSLRERLLVSNCKLQEQPTDADYILEVRVGALGTDGHEVNYGVPGSQALNQTASLISSAPVMPSIPEISLAKKDERRAAAKIAIFAYHRETKEPFWETGTVQGISLARSSWFMGAGPFYKGAIYESSELGTLPIELPSSPVAQPILTALKRPWQWWNHSADRSLVPPPAQLAEVASPPQLSPTPQPADPDVPQLAATESPTVGTPQPVDSDVVQATAILPIEPSQTPGNAASNQRTTPTNPIGVVDDWIR